MDEQPDMTDEEFEKLVAEGIDAITDDFAKEIDNVAIVVETEPSPQQAQELKLRPHTYLFGLYQGIPKTKRWNYNLALPDKITIFKKPILAVARTPEEIRTLVMETVWHEIGHHFGLSERQIRELEKKKRSS